MRLGQHFLSQGDFTNAIANFSDTMEYNNFSEQRLETSLALIKASAETGTFALVKVNGQKVLSNKSKDSVLKRVSDCVMIELFLFFSLSLNRRQCSRQGLCKLLSRASSNVCQKLQERCPGILGYNEHTWFPSRRCGFHA